MFSEITPKYQFDDDAYKSLDNTTCFFASLKTAMNIYLNFLAAIKNLQKIIFRVFTIIQIIILAGMVNFTLIK